MEHVTSRHIRPTVYEKNCIARGVKNMRIFHSHATFGPGIERAPASLSKRTRIPHVHFVWHNVAIRLAARGWKGEFRRGEDLLVLYLCVCSWPFIHLKSCKTRDFDKQIHATTDLLSNTLSVCCCLYTCFQVLMSNVLLAALSCGLVHPSVSPCVLFSGAVLLLVKKRVCRRTYSPCPHFRSREHCFLLFGTLCSIHPRCWLSPTRTSALCRATFAFTTAQTCSVTCQLPAVGFATSLIEHWGHCCLVHTLNLWHSCTSEWFAAVPAVGQSRARNLPNSENTYPHYW